MALKRRSLYGFPPPDAPNSNYTVRLIPLTTGIQPNTAWPLLPPGSATSCVNLLPMDGKLVPRSRLSSINTSLIPANAVGRGIAVSSGAAAGSTRLWVSGTTRHTYITSNGSYSVASFVSAAGIGAANLQSQTRWQYAHAFAANIGSGGDNMLVAAGPSQDTLLCLYLNTTPQYSYLTGAPRAAAVANFDNYVLAWNIDNNADNYATRVQWCVRGEPDNWTGEGAGFEDLLDIRGKGTAIRGLADGRLILFSDREIWYGVRAAYPAQFQFFPLDPSVGCHLPETIADTSAGLIFLGSDFHLRLLPTGGGVSTVIAPHVREFVRGKPIYGYWGLYDHTLRFYYLFIESSSGSGDFTTGLSVNVDTGEVGQLEYGTVNVAPYAGVSFHAEDRAEFGMNEGLMFTNDNQIVWSTNSLLAQDDGTPLGASIKSAFTATWRSAPIGSDLPGNYKQVLDVNIDYRATSGSTLTLKVATDGNTFDGGRQLSLASAPHVGRVQFQTYTGGMYPVLEVTSQSTGYELHRMDATILLGGRRQ